MRTFTTNSGRRATPAPVAFLALLLAAGPTQWASAAEEKPNFILINIDDLGYADIEPFGSQLNRTPHLNRMAEEGRRLTCFYAAPVCSPSRASLMTGCYPKRALSIPHVLFPGNNEGLSPEEVTIAELLKGQGYATGIIGKWHLGDQPDFLPTRQGFDTFYGLPYSNDMGPAADGVKSSLGARLPQQRKKRQPPLPLMRNETVLQPVLADDQTQFYRGLKLQAVRSGPWKLHLETGELYNLMSDIGEATDASQEHPDIVDRLRQIAADMDDDLGVDGIGPGCRPLGRVDDARPLINHDGKIRPGFEPS